MFYVQQKDVVVPGDLLAEGDVEAPPTLTYREGGRVYASVPAIVEIKNNRLIVTPLELTYIPKPGDVTIGIVVDIGNTYWAVDLNSPYKGQLPVNETMLKQTQWTFDMLRKYLDVGDYVITKVLAFDRNKDPLLTARGKDLGKVTEGKIVEVRLSRVPWIIGRRRSMIEAIAKETGTEIFVADNARVLVKGPSKEAEDLAVLAIKYIEKRGFKPPSVREVVEFIRGEKEKLGVQG